MTIAAESQVILQWLVVRTEIGSLLPSESSEPSNFTSSATVQLFHHPFKFSQFLSQNASLAIELSSSELVMDSVAMTSVLTSSPNLSCGN